MAPHQERVVKELEELRDKRDKLNAFIQSSPIFDTLPDVERSRLHHQLCIMSDYCLVLGERIDAFPASVPA
jgi:hypothetical protein